VDPVLGEVDLRGWAGLRLSRGELAEGAMRPGRVVVRQVLGQHPVQVLVGAENAVMLCDLRIFVDQAAEPVLSRSKIGSAW